VFGKIQIDNATNVVFALGALGRIRTVNPLICGYQTWEKSVLKGLCVL
jgi:hypothetical protein